MNAKLKVVLGLLAAVIAIFVWLIVAQKPQAPSVALTTMQGKSIDLASLRGKVVVVNFWATDCPGCISEMPALVEMQQHFAAQGLETLAVAMDYDKPEYVAAYAKKNDLPFIVAHDAGGKAANAFGDVRMTPTTFLIDKRGAIVKRYLGEPDFTQLRALVETLLQASA